MKLPVQGPISSSFGRRSDPFSHQVKFHKGIDIAAFEGMNVVPALPGRVIFSGYEGGYGKTVLVEHVGGLQTRYGHLGALNVKEGEVISSKDILGVVGSTGRSTGPHLHFEVMRSGKPVNPRPYLEPRYADLRRRSGDSHIGGGKTEALGND